MSSLLFTRRALLAGTAAAGTAASVIRYRRVVEKEQQQLPSNKLNVFQHKKDYSKVIIIGAGVVGIATAYKIAQKNQNTEVILLEPNSAAAMECSNCAAGGMQRSNPTVDKDSWLAVLKCLSPFHKTAYNFFHQDFYQTLTDPFFWRWLITFTKTSLLDSSQSTSKQEEMLKFTKYAVEDLANLLDRDRKLAKMAGYNTQGSLAVSYEPKTETTSKTNSTKNPTHSKMSYEPFQMLTSTQEILALEPSLRHQTTPPTSAKYEYEAKSASSGRFTHELAQRLSKDPNVSILYDTKVQGIAVSQDEGRKPRIATLKTNRGMIELDDSTKVVVAAGAWTPHILALMNLYAPVYPLKGYSMSVSAKEALQANKLLKKQELPTRIVCDKYMFTSRLGDDEIRITSIGEFAGWNTAPTKHVEEEFRNEAVRQFPQLQNLIRKAPVYCGHRPFVNDGILLLGAVDTHSNLYVSCGPGSNGWKLAMGSGEIVSRLIMGQTEEEMSRDLGFDVSVLSPAGRVLKAPVFAKLCRAWWDV